MSLPPPISVSLAARKFNLRRHLAHVDKVRDELRAAILRADGSARELAQRFEISERCVEREKARLRAEGATLPTLDHFGYVVGAPVSALNGSGWRLPGGGSEEVNRTIRRRLAGGAGVDEIAEAVGVANGYVQSIARELDGAPAPARAPARPGAPKKKKPLPVIDLAAVAAEAKAAGPIAPDEQFLCAHFHCSLAAQACARRQAQPMADGNQEWMKRPKHPYCAVECAQGKVIKLRLGNARAQPPRRIDYAQVAKSRKAATRSVVPPATVRADTDPAAELKAQMERKRVRDRVVVAEAVLSNPALTKEQQMSAKKVLDDEKIREASKKYGSVNAIGKALGISNKTAKKELERVGVLPPRGPGGSPSHKAKTVNGHAAEPSSPAGVHHHVNLPDPTLLSPEYLIRCVDAARKYMNRLRASLSDTST